MLKKIWILVHCVEGNSYPGTTQRYTVIETEKNPYHCTMCGKGLISRNHTKRHMKSLDRENLYQCVLCGNRIVETSKVQQIMVWKGRLKITKWKGTMNIKPKVQKSKISQNIGNILGHNLYPISVLDVVTKLIKVY